MIFHCKYLAISFLLVYTKICKNHVKEQIFWSDFIYCCQLMSAHYVRSFQNKHILELFSFRSINRRKMGNMKTGSEIVNPCIDLHKTVFVFIF